MNQATRKDGFKNRGAEMTRLESFVDAAFAFAVTLLVIGGGDNIPANYAEFLVAMQQVPAFALCFASLAFFWYAHHMWSRRFGLDDPMSTFLSLMLIFVVLIFVYPLKAIYSGAFNFVPGIDSRAIFILDSVNDFSGLLVVFGLAFSSLSGIIAALNWHALRQSESIGLSQTEIFDLQSSIQLWLVNTLLPLGSVAIAVFTSGELGVKAASFFYIAFGFVTPIVKLRREKLRKALML